MGALGGYPGSMAQGTHAARVVRHSPATAASNHFPAFAWGALIYNLAVILWGALVRATSSGAGCGGHWPLCNGEAVPQLAQNATRIEFTHRMMSGVALLAVVALFGWARRAYKEGHRARRWATWSLAFMLTEALLGAALVLLGYTARDQSTGRIVSLSLHLVNTFALLASLSLTAWWADKPAGTAGAVSPPAVSAPAVSPPMWIALSAVVLVAVAGAVTALGDTLFPSASLASGMAADFSPAASFLVRLRVIHPALAVIASLYLVFIALPEFRARRAGALRFLSAVLLGLVALQLMAGAVNLLLRAPLALQLVHLLVADCLWIALVLLASEKSSLSALPLASEQ